MPHGPRTRVLGIFAHPDDESFFAGATLAAYVAAGCEVRLITLTAGEAGVVGVAAAEAAARQPEGTAIEAAARAGAARYARACATLGVKDFAVAALGRWRDLGPGQLPGSLAAAELAEVARYVKEALTQHAPDVVLTSDEDGVTANPDHVMAHRAVVQAVRDSQSGIASSRHVKAPLTLGACVRSRDVQVASDLLVRLTPVRPIGQGGVRGVPDGATGLTEFELPAATGQAKRAALDCYGAGLGSAPLADLVAGLPSVGDGLLLRAIADVAGPARELFRVLS
ncbi:PIG-L deacetylase family protein [Actinopolymorpha alba]|uniref:PIG-L deacetylase family protein n=1 Tax=Actinopolymorpha alba TaxID=533267 RepID=UPI0003795640|nr:PIG-L family deacetylase [Actinopolymorpha alba]